MINKKVFGETKNKLIKINILVVSSFLIIFSLFTYFYFQEITYNSIDETLKEEAMDKALRPALMNVGKDKDIIPVRGPKEWVNGEYKYSFNVIGDINYFSGIETIYKNNKKIYELKCNGGLIM